MSQPSLATIKRLFAVSHNRCAFPKCRLPLVDDDSGKVTGRICHIKAQSEKGPRLDPTQTDDERQAFENLILMCPMHHDVIDDDTDSYTVERLRNMKNAHEKGPVLPEPSDDLVMRLITLSNLVSDGSIITSVDQSGGQIAHSITNVVAKSRPLVEVSYSWKTANRKTSRSRSRIVATTKRVTFKFIPFKWEARHFLLMR
jgi:hypothetical protein